MCTGTALKMTQCPRCHGLVFVKGITIAPSPACRHCGLNLSQDRAQPQLPDGGGVIKVLSAVFVWSVVACAAGYVETEIEVQQRASLAETEAIADSIVTEELVLRLRRDIRSAMPHLKHEAVESIYVRWATTTVRPADGHDEHSRTVVLAGMRRGAGHEDVEAALSHCRTVILGELNNAQH
jgi:uncharacterized protein (DUF983 family)